MSEPLSFLGDVWLPHQIECKTEIPGEYVFNLESAITSYTDPTPGKINLTSRENHIQDSFGRKPLAVCLANNHILDYAEQGYRDTVERLRTNGISFFGAGTIADNCNNPLVMDVGSHRIGLLGYVCPSTNPVWAEEDKPGVMPLEISRIGLDITEARKRGAKTVIVSLHWGSENVHIPKPGDVRLAHEIIDRGADLIIGHHAHCIQSSERYRGKAIFYGLGNCIFPAFELDAYFDNQGHSQKRVRGRWYHWNKESLMVSLDLETEQITVKKLYFRNNQTLIEKGRVASAYSNHVGAAEGIFSRYNRASKYSDLRSAVALFFSEPRLPKMSTVRDLLRWQ